MDISLKGKAERVLGKAVHQAAIDRLFEIWPSAEVEAERERDAAVLEGQANIKACAQNVVNVWDNPSPGSEKWDRLRQKINYLREALCG